jgi:hypothetical protein
MDRFEALAALGGFAAIAGLPASSALACKPTTCPGTEGCRANSAGSQNPPHSLTAGWQESAAGGGLG